MAEYLLDKAQAKADTAAKLESAETSAAKRCTLHSFYFIHLLFTLNDAKNPINSYNCALTANHFHQAGHSRTRKILGLILCVILAH